MDNPLVLQIVGGLLAVFFIFLMVMCWKTWRFTHIFFSFLVFAGTAAFLWIASMSLKTHHEWRTHFEAYTKAIAKAEAENEKYQHGDLNEVKQSDESIRSLRAKLDRSLVERGRVWRECTPTLPASNRAPESLTLEVGPVPASLPQGTTPRPSGIILKTRLYAFAEAQNPDGWRVPSAYLGEFSVANATPTDVVLTAVTPLLQDQIQKITQGRTTWTLYEIMPLDGHETLAEMDETEKRMVGLEETELARYIANPGLPQDKYDEILEQIHRYNREATEDDPPENTWVLVKFVKAHSIVVDSTADPRSLLDDPGAYFDTRGRAEESRVRLGELAEKFSDFGHVIGEEGSVDFEVGDTVVFDLETAENELIGKGICEKVKLVYRRDLHDYARFFRQARVRHKEMDEEMARAKRELDDYLAIKTRVDADILTYNDEKVKLEQDLGNFQRERNEATAYAQALDVQWQKTLKELSTLYQVNNQLAAELTRLQRQMAIDINRRAAEATARASSTSTQ